MSDPVTRVATPLTLGGMSDDFALKTLLAAARTERRAALQIAARELAIFLTDVGKPDRAWVALDDHHVANVMKHVQASLDSASHWDSSAQALQAQLKDAQSASALTVTDGD